MWIITRDHGIFNTDHFCWIKESSEGETIAFLVGGTGRRAVISQNRVLDKITSALAGGATFVEVD